jgi:hypothetical protein
VVNQGETIDNYYLHADLVFQPPFPPGTPPWKKVLHQGGFQSIDGMHPTGCGYGYIAFKVMEQMQLGNAGLEKLLEQAYLDDSLLHDFPMKLDLLIAVLAELRRLSRTGAVPVQPQFGTHRGRHRATPCRCDRDEPKDLQAIALVAVGILRTACFRRNDTGRTNVHDACQGIAARVSQCCFQTVLTAAQMAFQSGPKHSDCRKPSCSCRLPLSRLTICRTKGSDPSNRVAEILSFQSVSQSPILDFSPRCDRERLQD